MRQSLYRDQNGAIMVMGLFMGVFMIGFLFLIVGITEAMAHRERVNDAADAGAMAVAAVYARGMTQVAYHNKVMYEAIVVASAMAAVDEYGADVCENGDCRSTYDNAFEVARQAADQIDRVAGRLPEYGAMSALDAVRRQYPDVDGLFAFTPGEGALRLPPIEQYDRTDAITGEAWSYIRRYDLDAKELDAGGGGLLSGIFGGGGGGSEGGEAAASTLERDDVEDAVRDVLRSLGIRGPYRLTSGRGQEDYQIRVGAVRDVGWWDRSEAGALIGSFGNAGADRYGDMREMGRLGYAQAEYFGPNHIRPDRPSEAWSFRLRRFRLPPGTEGSPGADVGCARYGGAGCGGLDEVLRRTARGSVR